MSVGVRAKTRLRVKGCITDNPFTAVNISFTYTTGDMVRCATHIYVNLSNASTGRIAAPRSDVVANQRYNYSGIV